MANLRSLFDVDLEQQVADLRNELTALKRAASKQGSSLYDDAADAISGYMSDMGRFAPSFRGLRRQARSAERMAYDHPAVVAGVGLILIGLVASMLIGRRKTQPPARKRPQGAAKSQTRPRRSRAQQNRAASQRPH